MKLKRMSSNRSILMIVLVLLLVSTAAAVAIVGTIVYRSGSDVDLVIDLIPDSAKKAFRTFRLSDTVSDAVAVPMNKTGVPVKAARLAEENEDKPFTVEDQYGVVWETDTRVDIFKSSYVNEQQEITVAGKNSEKVIAPGTNNQYTFSLKNNENGYVDYRMTVDAMFAGLPEDKKIPVEVRLSGAGGWLLGSDETWEPVEKLKGIEESGILYKHESAIYVLEWRWPFESGQDELDTWLANQTQDVTLTIRITTDASYHWPKAPVVTASVPKYLNGVDHFAYIFGYEDGTVRPNANITRAEVAAIFYRLLWDDIRNEYETQNHPYTDIPQTAWYLTEVATVTNLGIMEGYPDGTFRGNQTITRAELATVLARLSDRVVGKNIRTNFSDIKDHWAEDEITRIEQFGWIIGYDDGTFRPDNPITRAETVTMVNRVLHRLPERLEDLHDDMIVWPDNADPTMWYYIAIQEASNSHDFVRLRGTREQWTRLLVETDSPYPM